MAETRDDAALSPALLREISRWSVIVGVVIIIVGTVLAHDVRFGVSCLIGAVADVGMFEWAIRRAPDPNAQPAAVAAMPFLLAFLARMALKAVLLAAALLLPGWLNLWGMAAGVLVVDFTLLSVTSALMVRRSFSDGHSGGASAERGPR